MFCRTRTWTRGLRTRTHPAAVSVIQIDSCRIMHLQISSTVLVLWMMRSVNGNDLSQPHQLTSISGDIVRMQCSRTVEGTVDWKVEYNPRDIARYICLRGRLLDKYKPRFGLDPDNYTLTIHDVMVNDSGLYYCVDDEGFGQPHFTRLDVVLPPPGQFSLVNRTERSLTIRFNQTGRATGYNVSVNGRPTSDVTYSGIGQKVVIATVHNLVPGTPHSVNVWSSRNDIYSKTSAAANYSTVPAAPGTLRLANRTEKCLTISWNQTGRVTQYTALVDGSYADNAEYFGVGTESVTAVLCCLSTGTRYIVNVTAVSDDDKSQAASGDFETMARSPSVGGCISSAVAFIVSMAVLTAIIVFTVIRFCRGNIQPLTPAERAFIDFNLPGLSELIDTRSGLLLERLRTAKCITEADRRFISVDDRATETRRLLEFLKYTHRQKLTIFIRCLRDVGQRHLASVMAACVGVLAAVHLVITDRNTSGERMSTEVDQISKEADIIRCLRCYDTYIEYAADRKSSATTVNHFEEVSLGNDVTFVSISKVGNLTAYFHCKTLSGLHRLKELYTTGRLIDFLRQTLPEDEEFSVTGIVWKTSDYVRCVRHLREQLDLLGTVYAALPITEDTLDSDLAEPLPMIFSALQSYQSSTEVPEPGARALSPLCVDKQLELAMKVAKRWQDGASR